MNTKYNSGGTQERNLGFLCSKQLLKHSNYPGPHISDFTTKATSTLKTLCSNYNRHTIQHFMKQLISTPLFIKNIVHNISFAQGFHSWIRKWRLGH